jgi:hypothetical protein
MTRDGCCSNPTHHPFSNTGAGSTLTHNKIPKTAAAAGNHISNKKLARFLHLLVHCLLYAEPVAATAAGIQGAHRSTICISIEHHATSTTTTTASSSSSSSRPIEELGSMPTIGVHTYLHILLDGLTHSHSLKHLPGHLDIHPTCLLTLLVELQLLDDPVGTCFCFLVPLPI